MRRGGRKKQHMAWLEQPPFPRTHPSPRSVLTPEPGGNGTRYRVAVVGNGPLQNTDRALIESYRNVIRFNDAKNLRPGERTTVHVGPFDDEARGLLVRVREHAHFWGVHNRWQHATPRHNYSVVTLNYQSEQDDPPALDWVRFFRGRGSRLPQTLGPWGKTVRIFEGCGNCTGDRCLLANGWLGLSSGGLIIEALNAVDDPPLEEIAVFGMNWHGESGHTDFRDPTLVRDCCARCVIHPTDSEGYLPQGYPTRAEQRLQDLRVAVPTVAIAFCIVAVLMRWANRHVPPPPPCPTPVPAPDNDEEEPAHKERAALVGE